MDWSAASVLLRGFASARGVLGVSHSYIMVEVGADLAVDARLGVHVVLAEHGGGVEVVEDVHEGAAVPVVSHPAAVVDVARGVAQNLNSEHTLLTHTTQYTATHRPL